MGFNLGDFEGGLTEARIGLREAWDDEAVGKSGCDAVLIGLAFMAPLLRRTSGGALFCGYSYRTCFGIGLARGAGTELCCTVIFGLWDGFCGAQGKEGLNAPAIRTSSLILQILAQAAIRTAR
jgi:hypothetical protein